MKGTGRTVGFDARMWDHPGIGRYIREWTRAVLSGDAFCRFLFFGPRNFRDRFLNSLNGSRTRAGFCPVSSRIYGLAEQAEMAWKPRSLEILHVPHFNVPVFYGGRLVVTIHDLIYLHEKEAAGSPLGRAYVRKLMNHIARKAALVLAVSEATRNDLLNTFPNIDPNRVRVTPEAASPVFERLREGEALKSVRTRFSLQRPFVLCVGSLKKHKNIPSLIRAVSSLRGSRGLDHELVLVGRPDRNNSDLSRLIRESGFVRYLGELSDEDLVSVYNLAEVFVLPSFREGFGLPVLEAMACGTPVIVSNRSSLPELAGKAALTFDPGQVDALAEVLYNVLSDNELRKNLSQMGLERVQQFSWKETARKTLEAYQSVLA